MKKLIKRIIFLLSFTDVMVDKVLLWSRIFEMEILIDLHVMRTPESKVSFLVFGLCVCMSGSFISIIKKQISVET